MTTNEKPIIFSGPMVRAILDGRKTVTRRVVVKWRLNNSGPLRPVHQDGCWDDWEMEALLPQCPYGCPGDRLWVRETLRMDTRGLVYAGDDGDVRVVGFEKGMKADQWIRGYARKTIPSIHMPRWASRLKLEVVSVRVERLQDVTEEDATAEGCTYGYPMPILWFSTLWNGINAKRGFGWDTNPWVWRVEFRRLDNGPARAASASGLGTFGAGSVRAS